MHFFQLPRLRKSFIPQNIPTSGQLGIFAEPHKKELTPNPQLHKHQNQNLTFAKPQNMSYTLCNLRCASSSAGQKYSLAPNCGIVGSEQFPNLAPARIESKPPTPKCRNRPDTRIPPDPKLWTPPPPELCQAGIAELPDFGETPELAESGVTPRIRKSGKVGPLPWGRGSDPRIGGFRGVPPETQKTQKSEEFGGFLEMADPGVGTPKSCSKPPKSDTF